MSDDPIAEAFALLEQSHEIEREHERWRATRHERPEILLQSLQRNPDEPKPEPPATRSPTALLPAAPTLAAPPPELLEAIGGALAHERGEVRKQIERLEGELQRVREEIATLRAESRAANELADLRRQVEIIRSDRIIDLPPLRSRGGAA